MLVWLFGASFNGENLDSGSLLEARMDSRTLHSPSVHRPERAYDPNPNF